MGEYNTYNVCHSGEEMPMGYNTNTCIDREFLYLCKVDYMVINTFMYVVVTSNYKKVMHIIHASYRVATIVKH
jgi:hypothetical protein